MWGWNAKGKGGKGKDKGKVSAPEGGKGHTLTRVRISAEKFTGTVVGWKGKYGWIKAAEDIEHEKAALRGGRLFAGLGDLIGRESLDDGAEVEFHIFEDDSGLGAEEIVQTGEGVPNGGKAGGKAAGKGGKGDYWGAGFGGGKGKVTSPWAGKGWSSPGWGSPWSSPGWSSPGWGSPMKGSMKGFASVFNGFSKGKDFGKGKGKSKKGGGKGHLLPRTRISAEKFTGTVNAWKGKYGWITPGEPIEHEKAGLHNGGLFASLNDLIDVTELTAGATVEFHIAEDTSGLCAEEVVVL